MHQNSDELSRGGVEKRDGYEVAFRWFYSRKKSEAFCMMRMKKFGRYLK
jgi:hypothetical protein